MKYKFSVMFLILGILLLGFQSYAHEKVHVNILDSYNIKVIEFSIFEVTPEKNCISPNCILANNLNEVVGYQIIPIYLLIFSGMQIMIILMEGNFLLWNDRL